MSTPAHPLGESAWVDPAQMPSAEALPPLASRLLSTITLSVLFEDHPAYAPLHAMVRLAGFSAELYEEAHSLLTRSDGGAAGLVVHASTRLEYAVIALHRAADHAEAVRLKMGMQPGFQLRRLAPATRGEKPLAITKLEKRLLGDLTRLRKLRDALEHADERLLRDEAGNTLLVPRKLGVSFDDENVSYADLVKTMTRLLTLGEELLDAGSDAKE